MATVWDKLIGRINLKKKAVLVTARSKE